MADYLGDPYGWDEGPGFDEPSDEPIGSCESCGVNLYEEDDDEYCDQCLWAMGMCQDDEDGEDGWETIL